jgi:predicted ABC-type ATPase
LDDANSKAWLEMVRLLSVAIANGEAYVFETTLGGSTIAGHLRSAASAGLDVRIWYVALANSDLHIARVQRRVLAGGHDVPDERIRARYDSSRANLLELMPVLKELWVYDNSEDLEDAGDQPPEPSLILYMADGKIVQGCPMEAVPEWAKSIVLTAIRLSSPE